MLKLPINNINKLSNPFSNYLYYGIFHRADVNNMRGFLRRPFDNIVMLYIEVCNYKESLTQQHVLTIKEVILSLNKQMLMLLDTYSSNEVIED